MDKLKAMANFVRIVDNGSLSSAADATGQSVASVVRSLAALERHLGVRLLNRSTRRMALTDEGAEYLAWSRRMLADFADMEQRLEASDGAVRGLLRITAPVEFGQRYVAPLVNEFLKEHAEIRVELNLSDQIVPLLDERLDLALRIGHLPDSAMVARQIGSTRLVTCASPDYLSTAPAIDTPAALEDRKRSINPTSIKVRGALSSVIPASSSTATGLRNPQPRTPAAVAPGRGAATHRALGRWLWRSRPRCKAEHWPSRLLAYR